MVQSWAGVRKDATSLHLEFWGNPAEHRDYAQKHHSCGASPCHRPCLYIIAKWRGSIKCLSLVNNSDRQAPSDLLNILQRRKQMSDPGTWQMHYILVQWHSYIEYQPTPQSRKIQQSFDRNLQASISSFEAGSTLVADSMILSYVDSSMRGKIKLRWRSSPPQFT